MRNAKHKGLQTVKETTSGLLKEGDECVTAMNGFQKACKKYISMRTDRLRKSKGQLVYQDGEQGQELHLHGRRKRRAMLGSSLLYHAEKDEDRRPENWIVAADVTAEFSQFKPALFTREKTPIDDILASMKVELDGGEDKMAAQLAKTSNGPCHGFLTMLGNVKDKVPSGFQDPVKAMPAEKMDGAFAPWYVAVRKHTCVRFTS